MTHNLLTLMESDLEKTEGIRNETEWKRKAETLKQTKEYLAEYGHSLPWVHEAVQRITQRITRRSVKFIRWLRNHLDSQAPWSQSMAALTKIFAKQRYDLLTPLLLRLTR